MYREQPPESKRTNGTYFSGQKKREGKFWNPSRLTFPPHWRNYSSSFIFLFLFLFVSDCEKMHIICIQCCKYFASWSRGFAARKRGSDFRQALWLAVANAPANQVRVQRNHIPSMLCIINPSKASNWSTIALFLQFDGIQYQTPCSIVATWSRRWPSGSSSASPCWTSHSSYHRAQYSIWGKVHSRWHNSQCQRCG